MDPQSIARGHVLPCCMNKGVASQVEEEGKSNEGKLTHIERWHDGTSVNPAFSNCENERNIHRTYDESFHDRSYIRASGDVAMYRVKETSSPSILANSCHAAKSQCATPDAWDLGSPYVSQTEPRIHQQQPIRFTRHVWSFIGLTL